MTEEEIKKAKGAVEQCTVEPIALRCTEARKAARATLDAQRAQNKSAIDGNGDAHDSHSDSDEEMEDAEAEANLSEEEKTELRKLRNAIRLRKKDARKKVRFVPSVFFDRLY